MIEDIQAAFADRTHGRARRRYIKPDVLVLEEFGYLPIDARAADTLFRIVSARHGQGSIILAANTGFTKWKDFFPSGAQAVATVDRLLDRATILRFSALAAASRATSTAPSSTSSTALARGAARSARLRGLPPSARHASSGTPSGTGPGNGSRRWFPSRVEPPVSLLRPK